MSLPNLLRQACNSSHVRKNALRNIINNIGRSSTQSQSQWRAFHATSSHMLETVEQGHYSPVYEQTTLSTHNAAANKRSESVDIETEEQTLAKNQVTKEEDAQQPHVPWYLQVQQPVETDTTVLSARQHIPELPEHPPAILEPLLQRISIELGMDDLSLLDLRTVDPPPALGANLFMIIGTARSEKHLHVSADKLCRWLRTDHDLTPYADGLLGRNELKLKLRRRAKRSRLLASVGTKATADSELEEGIRTGWVCVNLGRVEGGELLKTEEELAQEQKIVGFNNQTKGSRIVVQLLTEEKRGEIDLERLWMGVLKKSNRQKEALQDGQSRGSIGDGKSASELAALPSDLLGIVALKDQE